MSPIATRVKNMLYFPSCKKNAQKLLQFGTFQKKLSFYEIYVHSILVR